MSASGRKPCQRCGAEKPPGRAKYCSDECYALARRERDQERQRGRMVACARCGGAKDLGVRGGKYCTECRRVIADAGAQMEHERSRRKSVLKVQRRLAEGERISRRRLDVPDGQKWCARCQEFRALSSFPARGTDGKKTSYCIPCQRAYNMERRLRIQFGLSWDEYDLLLACQDGRCAICRGRPRKYNLSVDHDHQTGEIRGLLCSKCNHKLLGSANDNADLLLRAVAYLTDFGPREVFGQPRFVPGYGSAPGAGHGGAA